MAEADSGAMADDEGLSGAGDGRGVPGARAGGVEGATAAAALALALARAFAFALGSALSPATAGGAATGLDLGLLFALALGSALSPATAGGAVTGFDLGLLFALALGAAVGSETDGGVGGMGGMGSASGAGHTICLMGMGGLPIMAARLSRARKPASRSSGLMPEREASPWWPSSWWHSSEEASTTVPGTCLQVGQASWLMGVVVVAE